MINKNGELNFEIELDKKNESDGSISYKGEISLLVKAIENSVYTLMIHE